MGMFSPNAGNCNKIQTWLRSKTFLDMMDDEQEIKKRFWCLLHNRSSPSLRPFKMIQADRDEDVLTDLHPHWARSKWFKQTEMEMFIPNLCIAGNCNKIRTLSTNKSKCISKDLTNRPWLWKTGPFYLTHLMVLCILTHGTTLHFDSWNHQFWLKKQSFQLNCKSIR
jgi:hypothetical protein